MSINKFYSDKNLNLLVNISKKYFEDKYNFRISQERQEKELKDNIYEFMSEVNAECHDKPNITFERKNIAVLNSIKEIYIKRYKLVGVGGGADDVGDNRPPVQSRNTGVAPALKKPNMQVLSRDQELYGNRPVKISNNIIPDINPYQKRQTSTNTVNQLIDNRNNEPFADKKHNLDMSKLGPVTRDTAEENEVFMYKLQELEKQRAMLNIDNPQNPGDIISPITGPGAGYGDDNLNQSFAPRQFPQLPQLSQFQQFQQQPVSPKSMEMSMGVGVPVPVGVGVPMPAAVPEKSLTINSEDRLWWKDYPLRYQYVVDLKQTVDIKMINVGKIILPGIAFNYPYITLKIDEIPDLYCKLLFYKSYITENGRGYIILEPENSHIYTLNNSINKFNISLLKPNGQLFNNSSDHYKIITIELVEDRFKIITTKNDFIVGDSVLFKNVVTNKSGKEFNQFINSYHDIVEVVDSNVFYIECPICIDANHKFENISGHVMNMSLQHTISLWID